METLAELNISIKSVKALCTIDLKKDEKGLLEVVAEIWLGVCLLFTGKIKQRTIEAPSDTVFKYTGAYGVSEPAVRSIQELRSLSLLRKNQEMYTISVASYSFDLEGENLCVHEQRRLVIAGTGVALGKQPLQSGLWQHYNKKGILFKGLNAVLIILIHPIIRLLQDRVSRNLTAGCLIIRTVREIVARASEGCGYFHY